jgi:hypothetical protein
VLGNTCAVKCSTTSCLATPPLVLVALTWLRWLSI